MDISSLLGSLSEQDIQKLQQTAAAFFGGTENAQSPPQPQPTAPAIPGFTPELLAQAAKISSALSQKDARSDFILALKPLLTPERQKKADAAAMMVRLFSLFGAFKEGRL